MDSTLKSQDPPTSSGSNSVAKLNSNRNPREKEVEPGDVFPLESLPTEMLQHILSFLEPYDLLHNIRLVCCNWNQLALPLCRERQVRVNIRHGSALNVEDVIKIPAQFPNVTTLPWSSIRLPYHALKSECEFLNTLPVLQLYGNHIQALGLDYSDSSEEGTEFLNRFAEVVGHLPKLKNLEIQIPYNVEGFEAFVSQLIKRGIPSLSLEIWYNGQATNRGWRLLATQAAFTLKSLTLMSYSPLAPTPPGYFATLDLLLANCQQLGRLELDGFNWMAEADAVSLPIRKLQIPVLPNLKSFILRGDRGRSTFCFPKITADVMPRLELAELLYWGRTGEFPIGDIFSIGNTGPFTTVKTLYVCWRCGTPNQWKEFFPNVTRLRYESLETRVAEVVEAFPELNELRIRVSAKDARSPTAESLEDILPFLPKLTKLTQLCLGNISGDGGFDSVASDQLPAFPFPHKLHLILLWTKFTNDHALDILRERHLSVRVAGRKYL